MAKNKKTKVTADYALDICRSLKLHVFPQLGKMVIGDITAPIAIKTIKPLAAKGSFETFRRLCQRMNEIMIYANNTGVIHANHCPV